MRGAGLGALGPRSLLSLGVPKAAPSWKPQDCESELDLTLALMASWGLPSGLWGS